MSQGRDTGSIGFNIKTAWKNGKLQLTSSSGTISSGYDLIGK